MGRLLLNVLFVKFPVGQVLSPLLQSRRERRKEKDSDRDRDGGMWKAVRQACLTTHRTGDGAQTARAGAHPGQVEGGGMEGTPDPGRGRAKGEAVTWRIFSSTSCSRRSTPDRARASWQAGGRAARFSGPPSCRSDLALALQGRLGHSPPADTWFISRSTCPGTTPEGNWREGKSSFLPYYGPVIAPLI